MMAAPNISEISIERNGRDKEVLELSSSTRQRSRSPSPLPYPSPSPSTSSMRFSNATINAPHAPEQSSKQHLAPSSPVTLTYGTVLTHRPAAGGYDLRLLQAGFHTEPCMGGGGEISYGVPFVPKLPPITSFINNTSRIITTQTVYKCSHSFVNEPTHL